MFESQRWNFVADLNHSGSITISDVWLWFQWAFFAPGDGIIFLLVDKLPTIGQFFELSYASYGGVFSGIISFFIWLFLLIGLAAEA